ncbi:MAG: hypothetical protein L6Q57_02590 [Alphaproteobacteria bacterium]|nr:hypothetical protein [Alphaproteobacteria bacterium]
MNRAANGYRLLNTEERFSAVGQDLVISDPAEVACVRAFAKKNKIEILEGDAGVVSIAARYIDAYRAYRAVALERQFRVFSGLQNCTGTALAADL